MAAIHRPALPLRALPVPRSPRLLVAAVAVLLLGVALLQVNQFSAVTTTGYEIEDLKRERAAKQAENHALEAEVARLSSLARVDIEARLRLQMVPATRVLHIGVNQPVPEHQTIPTRFLPREQAPEEAPGGASFFERLLDLLPF